MFTSLTRIHSATLFLLGLFCFTVSSAYAASTAISIGQTVTFAVTADGTAPFSYQWSKDGVALSGANGSSYSISSAKAPDAGVYSVLVSNSAGSAPSADATLTVSSAAIAPVITTQPIARTVTSGTSVTFTAAANGTPTPTFQWKLNGAAISGATSATLTIANTSAANAGTYTMTATNSAGSVTSSGALLVIQPVPVAITTGTLPNAVLGTGYSTLLAANGGIVPYKWSIASGSLPAGLVLGSGTGAITGTPIASGTSAFTVAVSDGSNPVQTITKALNISVTASAPVSIWANSVVPKLIDQGADSAVELGVKFTSDVAGTVTGVRFYKSAANTGVHVGNLWSATGTLLSSATFSGETASGWQQVNFSTPVAVSAGTVYVVSYHCGSGHYSADANYFATAAFNNAPLHAPSGANGVYAYGSGSVFPSQTYSACNYWVDVTFQANSVVTLTSLAVTPAQVAVSVGATQSFSAIGTYSDASTKNLTSQVTWTSSAMARATITATGVVTGVSPGTATISATLSGISAASALTVNAVAIAPVITQQPVGQTLTAGNPVTFNVVASGTPAPTYQWSKDGINIAGATGASCTIASIAAGNAGTYSVIATNVAGSATSGGAVLTVNPITVAPVITAQPGNQTVTAGAAVTFSASASGTPVPTYQWMKNGVAISGATGASYAIGSATSANAGTYSVVASNSAGSATSSGAVLTVNASASGPVITSQPASQAVKKGTTVTFTVVASGTPAPTYQWRRNGTAIKGATSASYSISNLSSSNAGTYSVVVTNSKGTVTSGGAVLTITSATAALPLVDFNADNKTDIVWQNVLTGEFNVWFMNGTTLDDAVSLGTFDSKWKIGAVADFNADGSPDILCQNTATGEWSIWLMSGLSISSKVSLGVQSLNYRVCGAGDFDGDNLPDLVVQDTTTGKVSIWLMSGTQPSSIVLIGTLAANWQVCGVGDFDVNGKSDLVLQNSVTGVINLWYLTGTKITWKTGSSTLAPEWQICGTGDYDGDGKSDLLCQNVLTGECEVLTIGSDNKVKSTFSLGIQPVEWVIRN